MFYTILKNIIKKIFYNRILFFFSSRYIIFENLNKNFLYKKKILYRRGGYLYFLFKKIKEFKIKDKIQKKIYISLYTIIHELSSDCCINLLGINIESNISDLNLKKLIPILKNTLPQGISYKIKYNNKSKYIFKKKVIGYHKIYINEKINPSLTNNNEKTYSCFNIIIDKSNLTIFKIQNLVIKKSRVNWEDFKYENIKFNKIKKNFTNKIQIKKLKEINKKSPDIKNIYFKNSPIISKYKYLNNENNFIEVIKKHNLNKTECLTIIKNASVSYHGLISKNKFLVKESIKNSIWDSYFINNKNYLYIPKITRIINGKILVLPTATNHLSHYIFESLIRLSYLKNLKEFKFIVYNNLSPYLLEILMSFGITKKQILSKPTFETWNVGELFFPSIEWFEMSKKKSLFLSNKIIRKRINFSNNYKKIYISRRDSRDNRNLINEKEVENYLITKGFKIILASKLDIYKKINILENAEIIVTTLGSGLFNLFFCKTIKAKVVLIGTKTFLIRDFVQLSFFKKIKLYFVEANQIPSYSKQWQYQVSSFFIEIKNLKEMLNKFN
jgi:capsular polysaccharide biosynthesis protein